MAFTYLAGFNVDGWVGILTPNPISRLHVGPDGPANAAVASAQGVTITGTDAILSLLSEDDDTTVATSIGMGRFNAGTGALIDNWGITTWYDTGSTGSNLSDRLAINYGVSASQWGNSEKVSITREGDVGIGITNPGSKLHVRETTANTGVAIELEAASWDANLILKNDSATWEILNDRTVTGGVNGTLSFYKGAYHMVIQPTGNVGIGTQTPDAKLNITDGGTQVAISTTYLAHLQSSSNCGLAITAGSTSNNYIAFGDSDNYDEGIINYNNSTRSFAFRTADGTLDDLVIDSSGNVGIGTTTVNYPLTTYSDTAEATNEFVSVAGKAVGVNQFVGIGLSGYVAGNGAVKAGMILQRKGSYGIGDIHFLNNSTADNTDAVIGDSKMVIEDGGNVGIGTTSPLGRLHVENSVVRGNVNGGANNIIIEENGYSGMTILSSSGNAGQIHFGDQDAQNIGMLQYWHNTNSMAFTVNNSESMSINSTGGVTINGLSSGNVVSNSSGLLSVQSLPANGQNLSLGEGYAANIREKYYRTGKTVYPSSVGYQYANLLQQGIFNDSSLLTNMVATETGIINSDRPENGNGDFKFFRNSPASRVGSDGYIEKERINYLLQSNSLDISPWGATDLSVAHGAIDPSGGNTAWTVTATAANGIIQQAVSLTNSRVFSIYAKSGSFTYLRIGGYGGTQSYANFNLSTGTSTTTGTNPNVAIENVGNGWYRCTVYLIGGTTGGVQIFPSNSSTGNATSAGSVLLWNAQLEKGQAATEYIGTATVAVVEGVKANVPRIDYLNGVGELLLEPTSTNVVGNNSEMIGASLVTLSQTISPEGVLSGIKLSETATSGQHYARMTASIVSGTQYYFSFYVKKGTEDSVSVYTQSNTISSNCTVTFSTESISVGGGTGGAITSVGNGWYRVSYRTAAAIINNSYMSIYMTVSSLNSYAGDVSKYTEYYGVQLETAPILTSLIPTYGSALTRANENIYVMNMNENNLAIGANSATLMLDFSFYYSASGDSVIFRSEASQVGRGYLYARSIGFADTWGHSGFATTVDGANTKVIWRVDSLSSGTFYKDGAKGLDVSGTAWADIGQINISGYYGTMRVRGIYFAPTALTNAQCATLTTITQ